MQEKGPYQTSFGTVSWLREELYKARNFKPAMGKGLYAGTLLVGIDQVVFKGKAPWTLCHTRPDHACIKSASEFQPIQYPNPISTYGLNGNAEYVRINWVI